MNAATALPVARDEDVQESEFAAVLVEFCEQYGPAGKWSDWQLEQYLTALTAISIRHAVKRVA
jgi:hypothetical protein